MQKPFLANAAVHSVSSLRRTGTQAHGEHAKLQCLLDTGTTCTQQVCINCTPDLRNEIA